MRALGRELLRDVERAERLEWWQADGRGGWAASGVLGLNARRQHGLLVVATPAGRLNLLARLEERLELSDGEMIELATARYDGAIHPRGFERAEAFTLDPLPCLVHETARGRLVRTVARLHDTDAVVVQYEWDGEPAQLVVRPLLAYRGVDELQRERDDLRRDVAPDGDAVACVPLAGWPPLVMRLPGGHWQGEGWWYRHCEYALDREQGLEGHEDLWSPGEFRVALRPGQAAALLAAAGAVPAADPRALLLAEKARQRALSAGVGGLEGELRRAADAFFVRDAERGPVLAAGYPGPVERARGAAIALPGLCLAIGRVEQARDVLHSLVNRLRLGRLASGDEGGGAAAGDAQAALWFVIAVHRLREADPAAARDRGLEAAVDAVVDAWLGAGAAGLRVRSDGLVEVAADADDARPGCPVELQALWHNALLIAAGLSRSRGDGGRAGGLAHAAVRCRESVQRVFWCDRRGHLADAVSAEGAPDFTLRAAQLHALGLPHVLLPRDAALRALAAVETGLLTPHGLRSEAGGPAEPWWAGLWADARVRLLGEAGKAAVHAWLDGLEPHLGEGVLGQVAERFDGAPPHAPRGAGAAAASVGELLRALRRVGRAPRAGR
ncbi:MAG: glycogen debranching enzyme N-terminal domain-containing protein [Vicinamibacteria bacterium]|nr:glycogen debranching enzyme N-terminal domain-containing protein [Vicinamibacteria bacterium]